MSKWQFWIDRGGTFTDVIGLDPENKTHTLKLLSENANQYEDATLEGIRRLLKIKNAESIPTNLIDSIKMGTTVATNALLERKGEKTALVITKGFKDALRIAYQNRPDLFAKEIILPEQLYSSVIEIDERVKADGEIIQALNQNLILDQLMSLKEKGFNSIAIILMHAYQFPEHEKAIAKIAETVGFKQISISHKTSPLIKIVGRGDTTVVDAYLTPILRSYIDKLAEKLPGVKLFFMQSNGGLAKDSFFQGKNSVLSGPAGGVIGAVKTSKTAGFDQVIAFDMGGTSTDVSHYSGTLETNYENEVAGVRMRAPMLNINTIAAGGGSIVKFEQGRFQVGPESAGANPGPAAYGNKGPLTITDCNLFLGRLIPENFPNIFGENADQALNTDVIKTQFNTFSKAFNQTPENIASGFLKIAVENMANAIKKISIQRGYDISHYLLNCFGGAAGQHACLMAETLGIKNILIHPLAGVLSAYGIGLADIKSIKEKSIEQVLSDETLKLMKSCWNDLKKACLNDIEKQAIGNESIQTQFQMRARYEGTDASLPLSFIEGEDIKTRFQEEHLHRYGFNMPDKACLIESVICEVNAVSDIALHETISLNNQDAPSRKHSMYIQDKWEEVPVYEREKLKLSQTIKGPAIITEKIGTIIVEAGWDATVLESGEILLSHMAQNSGIFCSAKEPTLQKPTNVDPIKLEIFNNLYMAIAEQMGEVLKNTTYSINIKERLDFSCAIFDEQGFLIANAPHIPVHLGSMGASVQTILNNHEGQFNPGDVYVLNNPYNGGTHLPDITVITPVLGNKNELLFFTASRGHHADIGGITPGSMPPYSKSISEEGVLIDDFLLVDQGEFQEKAITHLLTTAKYPVRNVKQNISDLKAQVAANQTGVNGLLKMVAHYGLDVVKDYMQHVQDNAEMAVKNVLQELKSGEFQYAMDNGQVVKAKVSIDQGKEKAIIDFTGSSVMMKNNFNAPTAVCRAAVLYVLRLIVDQPIPMNDGCLKPVEIIIPKGCFLSPRHPACCCCWEC
jgi:5-oxoprolinase (ATP-hydrolysing)